MNTKERVKEYYVFILLSIAGLLLIFTSLYFYWSKSSFHVDESVMELTADQLPQDVFCKLVEDGLRERTSAPWNCSASYNDGVVNESKIYNLTEPLCDCSAVINNTPIHIQVRRSKRIKEGEGN